MVQIMHTNVKFVNSSRMWKCDNSTTASASDFEKKIIVQPKSLTL